MGVVTRLRAIWEEGTVGTDEAAGPEEPAVDDARGSLFQCPSCETVYIATGMARCSRCDVAVDAVRPPLARPS